MTNHRMKLIKDSMCMLSMHFTGGDKNDVHKTSMNNDVSCTDKEGKKIFHDLIVNDPTSNSATAKSSLTSTNKVDFQTGKFFV